MKAPLSWLKSMVEIDIPAAELAAKMTMAGLEAEKIEQIGADWDNVYVGQVLSVTRHPDADRLVLADVDAGEHRLTVVTGAPNIREGQKVALALAGAKLWDGYSDEPKLKTLKPGKIRGIQSEGMVCSEKELGLSDEHEGIMDMDPGAPVGEPLKNYLGDDVIEFEITPNLVHAFSIRGLAGEAGAVLDRDVHDPELADLSGSSLDPDMVTIEAPDLCSRYSGVIIDGVKVEPSPAWMLNRLAAAGVRSVNNLVDVTNYVMLEIGQPLHAFDLRNVAGEKIVVRRARDGETMETLDHTKRTFMSDDLLITDGEKPVAIAGVMGGVNSEVVDDTTSILLESAHFNMVSVRQTARRLKLRTDASARFERGLDPELAGIASRRAVHLILELCPDARVRSVDDEYPSPPEARTITFPFAKIEFVLGMEIPAETVRSVLNRLSFQPVVTADTVTVTVPTWRPDVTIREDVIEEVARIVGYDHLPATLPVGETPIVARDPLFLLENRVRAVLAASGALEGRSYITVSRDDQRRWHGLTGHADAVAAVELVNPINAEQPVLRTSLIPRLVAAVGENLKHDDSVRLFEIGHCYFSTTPGSQPDEPTHVALAFAGRRLEFDRFAPTANAGGEMDFSDLKGVLTAVFDRLGVGSGDVSWEAGVDGLHPGRSANISIKGERIGAIGELHPAMAAEYGVEEVRLTVAEFDLSAVARVTAGTTPDRLTVDHYLPVEQDFAIVVDAATPAAEVESALRRNAGPLLTSIVLFDVFEGTQLGEGKKSLAYRLTFTAPDRALTDAELAKQRTKIEKGVKALVGGAIRAQEPANDSSPAR